MIGSLEKNGAMDFKESGPIYFLRTVWSVLVILVILFFVWITGYLKEYSDKLRKWEKTRLRKAFRSSQKYNHE